MILIVSILKAALLRPAPALSIYNYESTGGWKLVAKKTNKQTDGLLEIFQGGSEMGGPLALDAARC